MNVRESVRMRGKFSCIKKPPSLMQKVVKAGVKKRTLGNEVLILFC